MMKLPQRVFVIVAAGFLAGCAYSRAAPNPQEETTVRVENQASLDMTIYVLRSSERVRLGTVTGLSTQVLKIPNNLVFGATPLRFLADPIGSTHTPVSEEIVVTPGDQVGLRIPPS